MYYKENEFQKDKEIITKTLKTFDCPIEDQMKSFLEIIPESKYFVLAKILMYKNFYFICHFFFF